MKRWWIGLSLALLVCFGVIGYTASVNSASSDSAAITEGSSCPLEGKVCGEAAACPGKDKEACPGKGSESCCAGGCEKSAE